MEQEIQQGEEDGAVIAVVQHTSLLHVGEDVCGLYGHKAAQCKSNPEGKEFSGAGGAVKKAGAGNGSGVEGPRKLTKTAKCRQNKLKKKAEE